MRLALIALLLAASGDEFARGLEAYRAGKFPEALEAFTNAVKEAGNAAPPELLFDQALAALAAGDRAGAEAASERAAARGGPRFARARDFLRGNVAYARSVETEASAGALPVGPGGAPNAPPAPSKPADFDKPIALAEAARDAWIASAAAEGPDLPEARRNVERALRRLEELKKKKSEAEQQQQQQQKNQEKPDSQPSSRPESQPQQDSKPESSPSQEQKPDDKKDQDKPEPNEKKEDTKPPAPGEQEAKVLSPEQVQRLLDKLEEKEKERQQLLRARARTVRVPRDW